MNKMAKTMDILQKLIARVMHMDPIIGIYLGSSEDLSPIVQ
jgi:hypothetical protein